MWIPVFIDGPRILTIETDETGGSSLDPNNPDHQAAVDDYFMNVVVPNRGRVKGAASFIAATGGVVALARDVTNNVNSSIP